MERIASFSVDHLLLEPGVYVSRIDRDPATGTAVTTFDLRLTTPNKEPVMNTAECHTIEHLGATFLRNHAEWSSRIVYFGPRARTSSAVWKRSLGRYTRMLGIALMAAISCAEWWLIPRAP